MEKLSKNPTSEIRIQVKEFKSKAYVDIREWFIPEGGDKWLPTKKGVTISLKSWDEFVSMITNLDITKIQKDDDIE